MKRLPLLLLAVVVASLPGQAQGFGFKLPWLAGYNSDAPPDAGENITRPMEFPLDFCKVLVRTDTLIDVLGAPAQCVDCLKQPLLNSVAPGEERPLPPVDCRGGAFALEVINGLWATSLANVSLRCGDRGVYALHVAHAANGTLSVETHALLAPLDAWLPLGVAGGVLAFAAVCAYVVQCTLTCADRRRRRRPPPQYAPIGSGNLDDIDPLLRVTEAGIAVNVGGGVGLNGSVSAAVERPAKPPRVVALDAFRGIALALMVFVNHGAGGYWFFNHATWNGLHLADFCFPWFVWIMGASIALSLKSAARTGKARFFAKICVRTLELLALGLFLNNGKDVLHWRFPGVLQRLALSYFFVAVVGLFVPKLLCCGSDKRGRKGTISTKGREQIGNWSPMRDVAPYMLEWALMLVIVAVHEAITFGLNVPGCGRGYLGPGGIGDFGKFTNCTGGAAGYIDRKIFGPNHIYQWPTTEAIYLTRAFDPEGILGLMTSIVQCFIGLQAGRTLVNFSRHGERLGRWLLWGVGLLGVGLGLCYGRIEGGLIPMNKNLWSLSFVCVLSGAAFIGLAVCYLLIDVLGIWNGHPFKPVGMNSIVVYVLSEVFVGYFPFSFVSPRTHAWLLSQSILCVALWIVVAYWLYFKKIFIALG